MSDNPLERHHLLLRRLHSLTGILPIGVFLIMHLTTNSSIVWGAFNKRGLQAEDATALDRRVGTFQHEVGFINDLPLLLLIEITLWAAIAFHAVLGVYYARTGKGTSGSYAYQGHLRYRLQRLSGYIGVLFIFYHVATLRWGWTFLVPGVEQGWAWSHEYAASTLALALRGGTSFTFVGFLVSLAYFVCVSLLVFHFANGLWTAAITWGLTVSKAAQRRWGYVCLGLGAGLMILGWSSVIGFAALDPGDARAIEEHIHFHSESAANADAN